MQHFLRAFRPHCIGKILCNVVLILLCCLKLYATLFQKLQTILHKRKDDVSQYIYIYIYIWTRNQCDYVRLYMYIYIYIYIYIYFCNIWKNDISFSLKGDIFLQRKWKMILLRKIHGNMIYFVYLQVLHIWIYDIALLPKKAKMIFSQENSLKGDISGITEKDDIHPRKYGIYVAIPYWLTF